MSAQTLAPVVTRIEYADGPLRMTSSSSIAATSTAGNTSKAGSGFGFSDFLDTINPLQQLPIVGSLYRAATGDEISQEAHYAGSALYGMALGGPIGMGAMVGMAMAEDMVADHFSSPDIAVANAADEASETDAAITDDLPFGKPVGSEADTAPDYASPVAAGSPLDLFQWLRPEAASAGHSIEMASKPFAPESVNDVAAHPDNHLPLSVLEALRQRHMGLLDNEPT